MLGFEVPDRADVDRLYDELVAAGATAQQAPYDAFWGARFAVLADPEGNAIGLTSPSDPAYRGTPPPPPKAARRASDSLSRRDAFDDRWVGSRQEASSYQLRRVGRALEVGEVAGPGQVDVDALRQLGHEVVGDGSEPR